MVGVNVFITGLEGLQDSLTKMSNPKLYMDSMEEVAEYAVTLAKQYAPVRTGNLMTSIKANKQGKNIEIECDVPYAEYQEYGTRYLPVGDDEDPYSYKSSSGKTAYRPFMRPAAIKAMRMYDKIFDDDMNDVWK